MLKKTAPVAGSVAIITNNVGCERHVQYYSNLEKYLVANHWTIADSFAAEKILICACGFHDFMMKKVLKLLHHLSDIGFAEENIILAGCLPKTHEPYLKQKFHGECVELDQEHRLDEIFNAKISFRSVSPPNVYVRPPSWQVPQDQTFYIKIERGCVGNCTYCVIKKAKGQTISVPFEEIKKQYECAIKSGYREISLMGEDTFSYGLDIGTNIIWLVDSLLAISPDVSLRFGNWHSRWLPQFSEDMLRFCKMGVVKRLHIGLQHVNEWLLRRMGRPLDFPEFYAILRRFRAECPDLYLLADIIIGFPGETPERFDELVSFFEKDTVFDMISHFGYSDVQGAPSSKLPGKVDALQIGRRWDLLRKVLGQRSFYNALEKSDTDRAIYLISLESDYTFCKDTYLKE